MNVKKAISKVVALGTGAVMLGATLAAAQPSLANYPAPFVENGVFNAVIGIGGDSKAIDNMAMTNIATGLQADTSGSSSDGPAVSGESASLSSGTNKVYLGQALNTNVDTLTDDDLPTILADGTFEDDNGDETDYQQSIVVGATPVLAFSDSGSDLDDPALLLQMDDNSGNQNYQLKVNFDSAVDFNDAASEGEKLPLFGREYTVGTGTDADTLVLLGGARTVNLAVGETLEIDFGGEDYKITVVGVSDDNPDTATITVNGDTESVTQGNSKEIGGVDILADTVQAFNTEANPGYVVLKLGSDEIQLEDTDNVLMGSSRDAVDGTLVAFGGTPDAMTSLTINVAALDNDADHLLLGESFTDTVFGTVKMTLSELKNGPMIDGEQDTSSAREVIEFSSDSGGAALSVVATKGGDTATLPFDEGAALEDEDSNDIEIVEGAQITEDEYTVLVAGNEQVFVQATRVVCDNGGGDADDDVTLRDQFTNADYKLEDKDLDAANDLVIKGQTFNVDCVAANTVVITSAANDGDDDGILGDTDGDTIQVFPYFEPLSGRDHRIAMVDEALTVPAAGFTGLVNGADLVLALPTGDLSIDFADDAGGDDCDLTGTVGGTTVFTTDGASDTDEIAATVGAVDYILELNMAVDDGDADCDDEAGMSFDVAVDSDQDADVDGELQVPGLLLVEEEDNSESDAQNAVLIPTATDGGSGDEEVGTPVFTAANSDTDTFDDSDFAGYLDSFGTYVLVDSSNSDHTLATVTFPNEQMYADVLISEETATIAASSSAGAMGASTISVDATLFDYEIASLSSQNTIIVAGGCVNELAADFMGVPYGEFPACAGDLQEGEAIIAVKEYGDYTALLAAGYSGDDTRRAGIVLHDYTSYPLSGSEVKVTGTDFTNIVVE